MDLLPGISQPIQRLVKMRGPLSQINDEISCLAELAFELVYQAIVLVNSDVTLFLFQCGIFDFPCG